MCNDIEYTLITWMINGNNWYDIYKYIHHCLRLFIKLSNLVDFKAGYFLLKLNNIYNNYLYNYFNLRSLLVLKYNLSYKTYKF